MILPVYLDLLQHKKDYDDKEVIKMKIDLFWGLFYLNRFRAVHSSSTSLYVPRPVEKPTQNLPKLV